MAKIMLDIALGLVRQCSTNEMSSNITDSINELFKRFIDGEKSIRPFLADLLQREIGSISPLEKIEAIMNVPDEPPPYSSTDVRNLQNPSKRKMRPWTEAEDLRLMAAVTRIGVENWVATAAFVGYGRTRSQCSQRWARGLNPKICRDHWTPEEDEKLISLVKQNNPKGWTTVSSGLGNRSDVQCRYRFCHLLKEGKAGDIPPNNGLLKGWTLQSRARKSQPCLQIWPPLSAHPAAPRVSVPVPRENHRKSSSDVRIPIPPPSDLDLDHGSALIEWSDVEEDEYDEYSFEQKTRNAYVPTHLW